MALVGLHVVCATATSANSLGPLPFNAAWSETLPNPGITAGLVPKLPTGMLGLIRVYGAVDSFVAVGVAPDATNGPRYFVAAGRDYDFYANPGDHIGWVAA